LASTDRALLEVRDLDVAYGAIRALHSVSLRVPEAHIVALIGSNGAGKTTLLRAISGVLRPRGGAIAFAGDSVLRLGMHDIVRRGIVQVPEGRGIFARMTVQENLAMGAFARAARGAVADDLTRVFALFPILERRRTQLGGTLSGGEQQMLALGRAIMARPRLLMLDEPSLGLAPLVVREIFTVIPRLRADGVTILLVEQNARMALACADEGYVLQTGRMVLSGSAADLLASREVQRAYLGAT
jgi:branched-chain amino acid transport system ATP-binding protein